MRPKIIVLRGAGTNCDIETASSFDYAGGKAELVHINKLLSGEKKLLDFDIAAFPGGFSYGDDISAGKIFAVKLFKILKDFEKFIKSKRPVIGICNGFQILAKTGFLPENSGNKQVSTLYTNDCGHFIAGWAALKVNKKSPCIFTKDLPNEIQLPIAHGEGKFIIEDKKIMARIVKLNLNALTYIKNPNGSMEDIAGIVNESGTCFGLMPHPERNFFSYHNPDRPASMEKAHFRSGTGLKESKAVGYQIFKNAIDYI